MTGAANIGVGVGASAIVATPMREIKERTAMRKRALDPDCSGSQTQQQPQAKQAANFGALRLGEDGEERNARFTFSTG